MAVVFALTTPLWTVLMLQLRVNIWVTVAAVVGTLTLVIGKIGSMSLVIATATVVATVTHTAVTTVTATIMAGTIVTGASAVVLLLAAATPRITVGAGATQGALLEAAVRYAPGTTMVRPRCLPMALSRPAGEEIVLGLRNQA